MTLQIWRRRGSSRNVSRGEGTVNTDEASLRSSSAAHLLCSPLPDRLGLWPWGWGPLNEITKMYFFTSIGACKSKIKVSAGLLSSEVSPWLVSESHSVVSASLQPHGLYSPWNSPGQNTGVGSLSLLQGIFPTQGSNPGLPHCRWTRYQLSHRGSPCLACRCPPSPCVSVWSALWVCLWPSFLFL